jgi:2-aminoadipate transaminase
MTDLTETTHTPQGVVAGSIPLFAGHPSHDLIPLADLQQTVESAFDTNMWRMFDYGNEQGNLDLINFLVERFNQRENLNITTDNLMIIAGSTGGVMMITNLLTQANDTILVDAPSYRDALHIFRDHHIAIHAIPIDEGGIIVEEMANTLESLKAKNRLPKFYYVVPTFQNPTGITLSQERREAIIELSKQYGFVIVEDDVYSDIRFVDDIPPSFFELSGGKNAMRLGTFSKTLSPGLRLGWLLGDAEQIQRFVTSGTLRMGGGASPFTAKIVADYCKTGAWDTHIQWLRGQYQARCDIALTALKQHMPNSVSWTYPQGGYFIWVALPEQIHVDDLEKIANENNVYFASGMGFYVNPDDGKHNLRLSFSFLPHDDLQRGIEILARVIEELLS